MLRRIFNKDFALDFAHRLMFEEYRYFGRPTWLLKMADSEKVGLLTTGSSVDLPKMAADPVALLTTGSFGDSECSAEVATVVSDSSTDVEEGRRSKMALYAMGGAITGFILGSGLAALLFNYSSI